MDIERKLSGGRRTTRLTGTLHRTSSDARRAAARAKVAMARAEAAAEGMPGIVGTAIPINSLDIRRKLLTSVGSKYLERIRTARSSYFEEHPGDRPGSAFARQPSLAELQIVGQQVPVLTWKRRAATPKPCEEELEEVTERLKTRVLEVEAVLRRDFTSTIEALRDTQGALSSAMAFMDKLASLADASGHLAGTLFQELLARHAAAVAAAGDAASQDRKVAEDAARGAEALPEDGGDGSDAGGSQGKRGGAGGGPPSGAGGSVGTRRGAGAAAGAGRPPMPARNMSVVRGDRVGGRVDLATLTDGATVERMVMGAQSLCAMLRIKIEDDNDLGLARTVVEDSLGFFKEVATLARWREADILELVEQLRMF